MTDVVTVIPFASYTSGTDLHVLERSLSSALAVPAMSGAIVVADHDVTDELAARAADRDRFEPPPGYLRNATGLSYQLGPDQLSRVFVIARPGHSVASALNAAIDEVSADVVICPLLVGDMFHPEIKQRQIAELLATDELCSFSGHHDMRTGATWLPSWDRWHRDLYLDNQFVTSSVVYQRGLLEEVGGYDESFRLLEDWDFALRVQNATRWAPFHDVTCASSSPRSTHRRAVGDELARARERAALLSLQS